MKRASQAMTYALAALMVGVAALAGSGAEEASAAQERNARWAVPVEKEGLPNLHRISDTLYRGAQPTAEGFAELEKMGVKTVINLRSFHSDRDELQNTKLAYEHIYMKAWHGEDEDVVRFLKIVTDRDRAPVFFHCQHGADRTGMAAAVYRVAVEGWTKEDAIEEMTQGGYGFHKVWKHLVEYVQKLNVEKVKREAGLLVEAGEKSGS